MKSEIDHVPNLDLQFLTQPEALDQLSKMTAKGLTWNQMAKALGVTPHRLAVFCRSNPECSNAINAGALVACSEAENKLFKKGCGYTYEEKTFEAVGIDPLTGEEVMKLTKVVTKQAHPDTNALVKWLANRDPERWSDGALVQFNQLNITADEKQKALYDEITKFLESNDTSR